VCEEKLKCLKCRRKKTASEFSSNKRNSRNLGKQIWCKKCHQGYNRDYWKNYKSKRNKMRNKEILTLKPAIPVSV
jgi:hypothetical protein